MPNTGDNTTNDFLYKGVTENQAQTRLFDPVRDFKEEEVVEQEVQDYAIYVQHKQPLSELEFTESLGDLTAKAKHLANREGIDSSYTDQTRAIYSTLLAYATTVEGSLVKSQNTRFTNDDNIPVSLELESMLEHASALLSNVSNSDKPKAQQLYNDLAKALGDGKIPQNIEDQHFIGAIL